MAAPRSHRPDPEILGNSLVTTTAIHGMGLPVRLRLLALLIALVIAAVSAPFASATGGADRVDGHRLHGVGRHGPFLPVIEDAE
ncbi:hypothetical protein ACFC1I_09345 [Microbacterium sp. NPDC056044]|uniref:hypothetical protein n=1 Tax=Microbacterium sp. NPDC056044 TaxID=3345690 RepID=UPI0035D7B019